LVVTTAASLWTMELAGSIFMACMVYGSETMYERHHIPAGFKKPCRTRDAPS
jgi:hypothetical protein